MKNMALFGTKVTPYLALPASGFKVGSVHINVPGMFKSPTLTLPFTNWELPNGCPFTIAVAVGSVNSTPSSLLRSFLSVNTKV